VLEGALTKQEKCLMAKKTQQKMRVLYTREHVKELRAHSKARTPVSKIAKLLKRTEGSIRQKALSLGIGVGHMR
jgi:hypothetical protein